MNNTIKFIISIFAPLIVGGLSGFFTTNSISGWYTTLQKPSFNPPNWIFGPVWTLLYIMMGIALFVIWKSEADSVLKKQALILFAAQLAVNFCWSFLFFYCESPSWALLDIIVMWVLIVMNIFSFGKISSFAAWMLVPYISWVSFAMLLNFAIWRMN